MIISRLFKNYYALAILIFLSSRNCCAQDSTSDVMTKQIENLGQEVKSLNDKVSTMLSKTKIGLSVGPVFTFVGAKNRQFADGYISEIDSSLQVAYTDRSFLVLSAVIQSFPMNENSILKDVGFLININLTQISNSDPTGIFNKRVDGGAGFAYRFGETVSLGLTLEYVYRKTLRPYYIDLVEEAEQKNEKVKIYQNGTPITELDKNNNNIFSDGNYFAGSLKLIFAIH